MKTLSNNLKRPLIWSLFILLSTTVCAQQYDWALAEGGLGLDVGRDVCADDEGNVIVVGSFSGSTFFADTFLVGMGQHEAFVCKYTSAGELLWARMISGPKEDMARGVMADYLGNIYVVGHFTDTAVVVLNDQDTVAMGSEGKQDVFVVKYNSEGDFQWLVSGGGLEDDTGTDIDWHPSGSILVCGGFQKRAKFGEGTVLSHGLTDAFLFKIDNYGGVHWVQRGGGLEHDVAASVAVDQVNGWVYIAGDYYAEAEFGGITLEALGSSDMFLAKYGEDGEFQWVVDNGGTTVDVATKLGTDYQGNVFISGYFQGTTYFQNFSATALSYNDVFLAKFDGSGSCTWLRTAGSWGLDNCLGMDVAWDGTTYLTGLFEEMIVADGDTTIGDGYDIFVLNYAPSGQIRYGKAAGAGSADIGMAIGLGPDQSLYITGYFYYYADFDQTTIGIADHGDMFLARLTDIVGIQEDEISVSQPEFFYDINSNTLKLSKSTKGNIKIFNAAAQLIWENRFTSETVQLPKLKSGYYLAVMETRENRQALRVIIK